MNELKKVVAVPELDKVRWFKSKPDGVKSMLANDVPGSAEALEKDGWTTDKPKGYVTQPTIEESAATNAELNETNVELLALVEELQNENKRLNALIKTPATSGTGKKSKKG